MPIYEYRCARCEHQFDAIQKFSEAPLTECPSCGQPELRKLISAPSFQLKGTGWYETDFKTKKKRDGAKADEGKEASAGSTEASKSESKGESKSDAKSDSAGTSKSESKSETKPRAAAAD